MATSSWNAPIFTNEDVKLERDSLTEEERKKIEEDLYGSPVVSSSSSSSTSTTSTSTNTESNKNDQQEQASLILFNKELERIPINKKKEYLEAMDKCPEVVQKEVDGELQEPYEHVTIDIEEEHQGKVMEELGLRKAIMSNMKSIVMPSMPVILGS